MSAEPPAAAAAAEPASALSGSPELADWQMVQPLSAEEHAEHARIQQAHAEQQAPQQPAPPAASDDMQIDDGAGDDAAADGTVDSASVEEKRLLDQASSTSLAGSSVSASPDPTASSVRGEPSTSPMPHQQQQQPGDVDVEMRDVKTEGGVKSESDAAATPNTAAAGGVDTISVAGSLVPSASSAADEAARQAAIREEEDARAAREAAAIERKRMEDRKPTVMRTDCSRCGATISFPAPARLVHCAVCTHVNAITQANSVDTAKVPLTDKTLPQQAAQWNTLQVVVFLRSLSLQHLAPIFELHQVDGAQLLDLTYYDVRDVLRIQKSGQRTTRLASTPIVGACCFPQRESTFVGCRLLLIRIWFGPVRLHVLSSFRLLSHHPGRATSRTSSTASTFCAACRWRPRTIWSSPRRRTAARPSRSRRRSRRLQVHLFRRPPSLLFRRLPWLRLPTSLRSLHRRTRSPPRRVRVRPLPPPSCRWDSHTWRRCPFSRRVALPRSRTAVPISRRRCRLIS